MQGRNPELTCSTCKMYAHAGWSELDPSGIELLDRTARRVTYRRGETIFHQDDEPLGIYCVRDGYVLLSRLDASGGETAFGLVNPGELMGYRSFFAEEPHAATAQALTTCRVCLIPAATVHELCARNTSSARWFLRLVARDRGPSNALFLRGRHVPIRARLLRLLLVLQSRFAQTDKDGRLVFELPLSRHEIAAMLGARPETIARTIRELEEEGLAVFRGRHVTVPEPERLDELAGLR